MIPTIPFRNGGGSAIPGFAVMRATGVEVVEGELVLKMARPNDQFQRFYYINGPATVFTDQFGAGYLLSDISAGLQPVLYDSATGTPTVGESWGATVDSWKLSRNHPGFTILGHPDHGRLFARQHEVTLIEGYLQSGLLTGATANVVVSGTEMTISVRDAMLTSGQRLPVGTYVTAGWFGNGWRIVSSAKCPEPITGS